jgi:hypothetical protein
MKVGIGLRCPPGMYLILYSYWSGSDTGRGSWHAPKSRSLVLSTIEYTKIVFVETKGLLKTCCLSNEAWQCCIHVQLHNANDMYPN